MSTKQIGKVVQCIGAVVDVEFPRDQLPKVYDALIIDEKNNEHITKFLLRKKFFLENKKKGIK